MSVFSVSYNIKLLYNKTEELSSTYDRLDKTHDCVIYYYGFIRAYIIINPKGINKVWIR